MTGEGEEGEEAGPQGEAEGEAGEEVGAPAC